ncbi:MAG: hypothetical protein ABWY54_08590 [Glaciihabitans sp.]
MLSRRIAPVAVTALAFLLLAGCAPTRGESSGSSTTHTLAPTSVGEWTTIEAWAEQTGEQQAIDNAALTRADLDIDTKNLSAEFGGAEAAVEQYQRDDMAEVMTVRLVAAQSPAYFVAASQQDKERIAGASAIREIQTFDQVECSVSHPVTNSAESIDNVFTECMRRNADLTVWLGPVAQLPADLAALTDQAWEEAGGTADHPTTYGIASETAQDPIALPSLLGGEFQPKDSVVNWQRSIAERAAYASADVANLESIYQAAAATQSYSLGDATASFDIFAFRASSPQPFVRYFDADRLKLLAATDEKVTVGDVACRVLNNTVAAGGDATELEPQIEWCFYSDNELTVILERPLGAVRLEAAQMAAIVDEIAAAIR